MYLTIQGIVLRVTDYNDRDALLTVLSRRHGKLTIKARGLRRRNSPLIAPCQLLAFGEFTLFEYRGMYTINEAHSLELFSDARILPSCPWAPILPRWRSLSPRRIFPTRSFSPWFSTACMPFPSWESPRCR